MRINIRRKKKQKQTNKNMMNSQFLQNWGGINVQQSEQNTCMYVSKICAEGIFVCSFPGDKNVKVGKK